MSVRRTNSFKKWLSAITDHHVFRGYNAVLGILGSLTGVIMLGIPERFDGEVGLYWLANNLNFWGVLFLAAGVVLTTTAFVAADKAGIPAAGMGVVYIIYSVFAAVVFVGGSTTGIGALWALGYSVLCLLGMLGSYIPVFKKWFYDDQLHRRMETSDG